jgi:IS30 family transposase
MANNKSGKITKRRRVTEEEKQMIFEAWQDRKPIKVIAIELDRCYGTIFTELRKRNLVG